MYAWPPDTVPDPISVAPSMNWTMPAGAPAPGATGATIAITAFACRKPVVPGSTCSVVVVFAGEIVSVPGTNVMM